MQTHLKRLGLALGLITTLLGLLALWFHFQNSFNVSHEKAPLYPVSTFTGDIFGTTYQITLAPPIGPEDLQALKKEVDEQLQSLNHRFSHYDPKSVLSKLSDAPVGEKLTDPDFLEVVFKNLLARSMEVSELTKGAFDITVGALVNYWGFGPPIGPSYKDDVTEDAQEERVAELKANVGYKKLQLYPGFIIKQAPFRLDLSAIAKGFSVEYISKLLSQKGYGRHLVDIGGETCVTGNRGPGSPWRVGAELPVKNEAPGKRLGAVVAKDQKDFDYFCMAGSGNYRNYRTLPSGQVISHELDPREGRPVQSPVAGVHVIAPHGDEADALATAMMVMSPQDAKALLTRLHYPFVLYLHSADGDGFQVIEGAGWKDQLAGAGASQAESKD